jgi:hypothetical protein
VLVREYEGLPGTSTKGASGTHVLPAPDPNLPYTLEGDVWSMELIKTLDSLWFGAAGAMSVGDIIPTIQFEINSYPDMYFKLRESMETYGQRAPIYVAKPEKVMYMLNNAPTLSDGIHRVAIADMLGWKTMIVSDEPRTWHEWDNSEVGLEYRYLWEKRLGLHK